MLLRAWQLTAAAPGAGLEFVKAMWGCLFAGIVAVPVCPPNPLTLQTLRDTLPHFQRILDDSGAVAILTDSQFSLVSPAVSLSPAPHNCCRTAQHPARFGQLWGLLQPQHAGLIETVSTAALSLSHRNCAPFITERQGYLKVFCVTFALVPWRRVNGLIAHHV